MTERSCLGHFCSLAWLRVKQGPSLTNTLQNGGSKPNYSATAQLQCNPYKCTHALTSCSCVRHAIQLCQWASMALTKHMGLEFIAHSKQNKINNNNYIFIVTWVERLASLVQIHCTHQHCFWKMRSKKPKGSQLLYCSHNFCTGFARPLLHTGNRQPLKCTSSFKCDLLNSSKCLMNIFAPCVYSKFTTGDIQEKLPTQI